MSIGFTQALTLEPIEPNDAINFLFLEKSKSPLRFVANPQRRLLSCNYSTHHA